MRTTIVLIILIATLFTGVVATQSLVNTDPDIVSVNHSPYIPTINDTVVFQTSIRITGNQTIDNVTLTYTYNNSFQQQAMFMNSTTNYTFKVNFTDPGKVNYYMELFYDNRLVDTSAMQQFSVIENPSDIVQLVAQNGVPLLLRSGNYSIKTPKDDFMLNFSTNDNIEINISSSPTIEEPPANNVIVSTPYNINSNDTGSMSNITLALNYNDTTLTKLGSTPEFLNLRKRENMSSSWTIVNATLDEENSRLITEPSSFSQWVITVEKPYLQFTEVTDKVNTQPNSVTYITTTIGNLGGSKAVNVSIRLVIPETLIAANGTLNVTIDEIMPNTNISFQWGFTTPEQGEYNLVAIVEGINSEGDLSNIQIISTNQSPQISDTTNETTNQSTSQTTNTPYLLSYLLLPSILVLRSKRK